MKFMADCTFPELFNDIKVGSNVLVRAKFYSYTNSVNADINSNDVLEGKVI